MTGIVGFIGNNEADDLMKGMCDTLIHSRKEEVDKIDLGEFSCARVYHNVVNRERQPIFNEDKSLCIFMDGEVYNEKSNGNDASYCLHLYQEKGKNSFQELNGSFCIVIYSLNTHELLLVNDRLSSRPVFYYLTDDGMLLFGTQLSSILQPSMIPRELNLKSVFEYFTFQKVLGTETFINDVNVLPRATVLHYKDGEIILEPYVVIRYKPLDLEFKSEDYYANQLAKAIKKSVKRRLKGNYRFGLLLSGGLDSRTILAASSKKMVCFTIADYENRQVRIARKIANIKECKHVFLKHNPSHYVQLIDEAVELGNGLNRFDNAHNLEFFEEIKKNCDVLLDGFGFDGLFKTFYRVPKRKLLGKSTPYYYNLNTITTPLFEFLLNETLLYQKGVSKLFKEPYKSKYEKSIRESVEECSDRALKCGADNPYRKADCLSGAHSMFNSDSFLHVIHNRAYIDERFVASDKDLIDLSLEMPTDFRMHARVFKKAMKKIDPRLASITNANTGCSPYTPKFLEFGIRALLHVFHHLLHRLFPSHPVSPKQSWPNFGELTKNNNGLLALMSEIICDEKCLNPSIFDIAGIKEMFYRHIHHEEDNTDFLLLLLTFGRWYKRYGPKKDTM